MPGMWEEIVPKVKKGPNMSQKNKEKNEGESHSHPILANEVLRFSTYQARLSLCYGIPEK